MANKNKKILIIIVTVFLTIIAITNSLCTLAATVTASIPLGYYIPDWNYTVIVTRESDGLTYSNNAPNGSISTTAQNRFSLATQYKIYDANTSTYYTYTDSPNCYGYPNNNTDDLSIPNKIELYGTTNNAYYIVQYVMRDLYMYGDQAVMPTLSSATNATVNNTSYYITIEFETLEGNFVTETYTGAGVAPVLTNSTNSGILDYARYDESAPIHILNYIITINAKKTSTSTSNVGITNNYRFVSYSNYTDADFDLTYNGICREEFYQALGTVSLGYNVGYEDGFADGEAEGYTNGRNIGYVEGSRAGYYTGYDEGLRDGHNDQIEVQYEDLSFTQWLTVSVGSIFDFEIMPNVSIGLIMGLVVGAALFAFAMRLMR